MFQAALQGVLRRIIPDPLEFRPLLYQLPTGIQVHIDSKDTLAIFLDLFVLGAYGPALEFSPAPSCVVDLGSHRGLFVLLVCHQAKKRGAPYPQFLCVEADERNIHCMEYHLRINGLQGRVSVIHGAVTGRRWGTVGFSSRPGQHGSGRVSAAGRGASRKVPVLDLARAIPFPRVDLLKMDIEGSEQGVFREYPDVLAKTEVLAAEFHLRDIDYEECRSAIEKSGLRFRRHTMGFQDPHRVEIFTRDHAEGEI